MPMSPTRAASMRAYWANSTPEQRAAQGRKMRRALAIKEIVDQAPELTQEQRQRLALLLRPPEAVQGGGPDARV
jgi:hypothetical protein